MLDRCGRNIDYLRISVTDRCNMRCRFCMPPDGVPCLSHDDIMRYEEILTVTDAASELGIDKYRVSGGEPLLRKGLIGFLAALSSRPATGRVSLTTNGLLLERFAEELAGVGLASINVSLDTLSARRLYELSGCADIERIVRGIDAAVHAGLPVKINTLLFEPVLDELPLFLDFAESRSIPIRFIEFMPLDPAASPRLTERTVTSAELREALERLGATDLAEGRAPEGCGPSRYLGFRDRTVVVGIIDAVSSPFCDTCNRIRLTPDGKLKPCLASPVEFDVLSAIRSGADVRAVREFIERAIGAKPDGHRFDTGEHPRRCMSRIGG